MKNLNPLYESDESNKDSNSSSEKYLPFGAGLAGAIVPGTLAALPATSKFTKGLPTRFYTDGNVPSYLRGLKVNGTQDISDYLRQKNITVSNGVGGAPYFNPQTNTINMDIHPKYNSKYGKSLFAHELGHSTKLASKDGKIPASMTIYGLSKSISGMAAVGQLINCFNSDDESRKKVGRALSVAGGVSALPMIAEEIRASYTGSKMLGLQGGDAARAYIGIASYIAWALSPTIIYFVSEKTRQFIRALRKAKQESPETNKNISELKHKNIKVKI